MGKYKIVGSPDEADLIVELTYRVEHNGTRVWSSTNSYDGTTQVHSAQIVDPQLGLAIYDAKSKTSLWSTIDHRRLAIREKNREKETIISAERLVDELKARANLAAPSVSPVAEAPAVPVGPATGLPQSAPISITLPERAVSTPPSGNLGTVSVTSDPDGAEIFVDSVGHGYAPAILKLPPGKHFIQLVRPESPRVPKRELRKAYPPKLIFLLQLGCWCNGDLSTVYGRTLPVRITVLRQYGSPRSPHGEKGAYESPVSEDGDIGQDANYTRDLAARAERKNADPKADGPDGSQQPHDRETRTQKDRKVVRVRKDSASRANERTLQRWIVLSRL